MKKAKCQLFVVSEEYVDQLTAQLKKYLQSKDLDDGLMLGGMLALIKEHRIPRKATLFAQDIDVDVPEPHRAFATTKHVIVNTWPMPKELLIDDHNTTSKTAGG